MPSSEEKSANVFQQADFSDMSLISDNVGIADTFQSEIRQCLSMSDMRVLPDGSFLPCCHIFVAGHLDNVVRELSVKLQISQTLRAAQEGATRRDRFPARQNGDLGRNFPLIFCLFSTYGTPSLL